MSHSSMGRPESEPAWLQRAARNRAAWITVLVLALAVRLAFLVTAPPRILWSDGRYYEDIGWRLVSEHRYLGSQYIGPAYPGFIAGVYAMTGRNLFALRLVQVILSSAAVGLAGALGAALFSPAVGLLAAVLMAFHPILAFLPVTQYIEDLLVLVSVLLFGGFALAARRPGVGLALGLGALFGLFMLLKPVVSAYLPGLALGGALEMRRARVWRARYALAFALALAVVLAPWALRNQREYHRFMLVSGGAEEFLWMANNDAATGWEGGPPAVPAWLEDSLATRPSLVEKNRFYGHLASDWIRAHPGRAVRLYVIRLANLWSPYPRTVTPTEYRNTAANWAQGIYSAVLFLGLLLGAARLMRSGRLALVMAALSYLLIAPIFITVLRYRMSMEIILIWTAALGYQGWLERLARRSIPPLDRAHPAEVRTEG
jgi:4-amino-4-deoxy-L-arabinose transferase-like glycosyltransferase